MAHIGRRRFVGRVDWLQLLLAHSTANASPPVIGLLSRDLEVESLLQPSLTNGAQVLGL